MRRLFVGAVTIGGMAACAVGPNYKQPPLSMPEDWRPPSSAYDSTRPFFDSLATIDTALKVGRDSMTAPPAGLITAIVADTLANPTWFDLLQDTTLQQLVDIAIQNNLDVQTAVATISEFRAQYFSTRGSLFPQLSANGRFGTAQTVFPSQSPTPIGYDQYLITADLAWELDFFGKLRRATQAGKAEYLAREENQRAVILSLVSDVATAYLELREADLDLEIARRTLASRLETLRLSQERYAQGLISELDVKQFEAQVADPSARVAQFEQLVTRKENQLSVLLGSPPGAIPRGRTLSQIVAAVTVPAGLPSSLLQRRPDVRRDEQSLAAAIARIGAAKGQLFPTITLTGQYGTASNDLGNLFQNNTDIYQLFGGISIPIFTGGRVGQQVNVARAQADQASYRYQKTVLTALQETNDALTAVRSTRDQTIAKSLQVNALRTAERLATMRYENGISSYLDVLDAQRSLFQAELELTQAERAQLAAAVQLYKALGGGWPVSPSDSVSVPATKLPGE